MRDISMYQTLQALDTNQMDGHRYVLITVFKSGLLELGQALTIGVNGKQTDLRSGFTVTYTIKKW